MKIQRLSVLIVLTVFLSGSCTIEKRVHLPGWHIASRGRNPASQVKTTAERTVRLRLEETAAQPASGAPPSLGSTSETTLPEVHESIATAPVPIENRQLLQVTPESSVQPTATDGRVPPAEQNIEQADGTTGISASESQRSAGLLLAPIRILFTILLIALVIVGVVMLFVLESALGGTVLLAAGAVLLILIIL